MKFRINAVKDNKQTYYILDNQTLDIWNEYGIPANLDLDVRFANFRPKTKPDTTDFAKYGSIVGKHDIKKIKISLGFKCNYRCAYCWQHQFEREAVDATPTLIASFMSKLRKLDLSSCRRMDLWGGEPLVYWKTVKPLIEAIKSEYPDMDIAVQSNGSLLTKEIADFLIKHDIKYGISHDGPGFTQNRDKVDPLDTNRESIKYFCYKTYKTFGRMPWFSATLNKQNLDLDTIYPYFWSKLGQDTPFYIHIDSAVITATEEEYKQYAFTPEEQQKFFASALKVYLNENHPLHNDFAKDLKTVLFRLVNKITPWQEDPCDMTGHRVLACNLRGDVLPCHSFPNQKIGTLDDLASVKLDSFVHWSRFERCKQCPILPICRGGRPCVSEENHKYICNSLITWRYPMLLAAWKILFDAEIASIEPYFED